MKWRLVLWTVALAAAVVPWPSALVERLYSRGMFPLWQAPMTSLSNRLSFALFDFLLVAVVLSFVILTVRDARKFSKRRWRAVGRVVARVATIAAGAYLAFLAAWGLNYRRQPIDHRLQFDVRRVTRDRLVDLGNRSADQLNVLHAAAHRRGWPPPDRLDHELAAAFAVTQRALGASGGLVPARPKRTLLDGYFRRAGVAGMTDPYFLETLVASDLLPIERPMVVAHEWSHLAGLADEGEANFAGWLACLRGTPSHQYSAWLFLYSEVAGGLPAGEQRRLAAALTDGPRADLEAIRQRLLKNLNPTVSAAGWRVYDQYLKANRIDEGTASYGQVVRLVLGTQFDAGWSPRLR